MKQLDPKSVWLFFINSIVLAVFLAVFLGIYGVMVLSALTGEKNLGLIFAVVAPVLIIIVLFVSWFWAKLSYKFYRYELTDLGFRKESGVIWKQYITIPYDRIQNVDIYRGIWARILGLSDLQIQTAGLSAVVSRSWASGVGAEGRLPGLSAEDAEQLRDELIIRARNFKHQGL